MDDIDLAEQPRCPACGTVLRDTIKGYVCGHCKVAYLPNLTKQ